MAINNLGQIYSGGLDWLNQRRPGSFNEQRDIYNTWTQAYGRPPTQAEFDAFRQSAMSPDTGRLSDNWQSMLQNEAASRPVWGRNDPDASQYMAAPSDRYANNAATTNFGDYTRPLGRDVLDAIMNQGYGSFNQPGVDVGGSTVPWQYRYTDETTGWRNPAITFAGPGSGIPEGWQADYDPMTGEFRGLADVRPQMSDTIAAIAASLFAGGVAAAASGAGAGAAGAAAEGAGAAGGGAAGGGATTGAGISGFGDAGLMYAGADAGAAASLGGGASVGGGSAIGAGGVGISGFGDAGTMYAGADAGSASSLGGGASVGGGAGAAPLGGGGGSSGISPGTATSPGTSSGTWTNPLTGQPMDLTSLIGPGLQLAGSAIGAGAANSAADAQIAASDRATQAQLQGERERIAFLREAMDKQIGLTEPWRQQGTMGLNRLAYMMGVNPSINGGIGTETIQQIKDRLAPQFGGNTTALDSAVMKELTRQQRAVNESAAADPNFGKLMRDFEAPKPFQYQDFKFEADPGYGFRRSEGERSLNSSLAARGQSRSGNAMKEAMRFGQGLASQEYGNAFNRFQSERNNAYGRYSDDFSRQFNTFNSNRSNALNALQSLAGVGQTATSQMAGYAGQFGTAAGNSAANSGNAIANNAMNAGNASAAGRMGMANNIVGGINSAWNAYQGNQLMNMFNRPSYGGGGGTSSFGGGGLMDEMREYGVF